jgi:hypothetical protein
MDARRLALIPALALVVLSRPSAAQASEYFLMAGDQSAFVVVQNGQIVRTWTVAPGTGYQYPMAVSGTLRTLGKEVGDDGAEYDLDGTDLGPRYPHGSDLPDTCWDGTTDGQSNYVGTTSGDIWQLDLDWQNPVQLFPGHAIGSLAYDPTDDSFWVGGFLTSAVEHYSRAGTLLGSIPTGHTKNMALALDHADGTLWLHDRNSPGTLEQWSKGGTLLQRIAVPGLGLYNALGGEFPLPQQPGPGTPYCPGDGSGAACPCGNSGGAGGGCANSMGSGSQLTATGTNQVSADDIVLSATGSTPGQPGLLFQGDNAINGGDGLAFGDGLRCAGGNVVRLEVVTADGAGAASSTVPIAATGGVSPGDIKRYQWWYRDPTGSPCGAGFNLSNGLEVTWAP